MLSPVVFIVHVLFRAGTVAEQVTARLVFISRAIMALVDLVAFKTRDDDAGATRGHATKDNQDDGSSRTMPRHTEDNLLGGHT